MMTESQQTTAEKQVDTPTRAYAARRPRALLVLTALLAIFQASAAVRAFQTPDAVANTISISPAFMGVMSGLWAVLAAGAFILLWAGKRGARRFTAGLVIGFSIYSLSRLLLFSQADYDRGRLPFLIVITVGVVIVSTVYILRGRQI